MSASTRCATATLAGTGMKDERNFIVASSWMLLMSEYVSHYFEKDSRVKGYNGLNASVLIQKSILVAQLTILSDSRLLCS